MASPLREDRNNLKKGHLDLIDAWWRPVLEVTYAESIIWPHGRQIAEHAHEDLWQFDMFKGSCTVTVEGRPREVSEWAVSLIPPHTAHGFAHVSGQSLRGLGFKFSVTEGTAPQMPVIYLTSGDRSFRRRTEARLVEILDEWQMSQLGRNRILSSLATTSVVDLVRRWLVVQSHPTGSKLVEQACAYMESAYAQPLTMERVAEEIDVSTDRLSRLFQRELQTTPSRYLLDLRLRQAEVLLQSGYRVTECAELTGFSSVHYFSRAFKEHHGASPMQWLKRVAEEMP